MYFWINLLIENRERLLHLWTQSVQTTSSHGKGGGLPTLALAGKPGGSGGLGWLHFHPLHGDRRLQHSQFQAGTGVDSRPEWGAASSLDGLGLIWPLEGWLPRAVAALEPPRPLHPMPARMYEAHRHVEHAQMRGWGLGRQCLWLSGCPQGVQLGIFPPDWVRGARDCL